VVKLGEKNSEEKFCRKFCRNFFLIIMLFISLLILGCFQPKNFSYGVKLINNLNAKYNTSMDTYPKNIEQINLMLYQYNALKKLRLESGEEPFNYVIDYRVLNLEAEELYLEGFKYGEVGTTEDGFGCKQRPLIIESVQLRNSSALKGFEAVDLLRGFIIKYPKEANLAGLSSKNALFLNATFYQISRDARRDSNIINHFCPQNETFKLYKEEFRKKTNLSEEYITNLTYDEAVPIWKEIRGLD
jgi:hypothetical protein